MASSDEAARSDGDIVWTPPAFAYTNSAMAEYMQAVNRNHDLDLRSYEDLHAWSIAHLDAFWRSLWHQVKLIGAPGEISSVCLDDMIGCQFFPESSLNFAENCLRRRDDAPAIIFTQENLLNRVVSWDELYRQVYLLIHRLRAGGLVKGDRVCAVVANVPETVVCMLATASIGAIWSSVSPDFGVEGILERFAQIEPKVFFHTDSYYNKNRVYDVSARMQEVETNLRSLVPDLVSVCIDEDGLAAFSGSSGSGSSHQIAFEQTSFNDPLFIMFSSGTTGKPKCIVHRHGVLLQLMKEHQLHCDIKADDRVFYYTTTTWMMWNWLVSVLASEATILLYEGNPFFPDSNSLFKFVGDNGGTFFGVSAKFIDSVKSAPDFISPPPMFDTVRTIASTGSPLVPESYDFVYSKINPDVNLASICGGTDILSCFILGCPIKPVKRGFSQCRGLGMDVQIWDPDTGKPVIGQKGELVCCKPFPSQPIGFWGDTPEKTKYREAYFGEFPNKWKHGDYCSLDSDGHVFVYGRSDATLKPGGVRIGTAEIYRSVEALSFIKESLCCGIELKVGEESVALFITLADPGAVLDDAMRDTIRKAVGKSCTRHHVPKIIEQVSDIPRTKSGKIVELAVKNVLHHRAVKNLNALANPEALAQFEKFAVRNTSG